MVRSLCASLLCLVLLGVSSVRAQDAINTKLDAARAAYHAGLEEYRASACAWLDRRENEAREKGNEKNVDQIKKEREAFEENDALSDSAPPAVKRLLTKAQADMQAGYRTAVAEFTRDKRDDEAATVEKEWDSFKKHEIAEKGDRLRAGTVWKGQLVSVTEGRPAPAVRQLTLTILERDGDRFKARAEAATTSRILMGHIKGRRIWWTREDVIEVVKGTGPGADVFGYLNGKQIRMRFEGKNAEGKATLGVTEYHLDESK